MAKTITIDFSGADSTNKYYVLKEAEYEWTATAPEDAASVLALYTGDENTKSVAVKIGEGDTIAASNATGVAISACAGFKALMDSETVTGYTAIGNAETALSGTLTYSVLSGLSVAVKTAASAENNTGADSATLGTGNALTVSKGVVVTAAEKTYTEAGTGANSTMALALTATNSAVTGVALTAGAVSIAAGGTLTVKGTTFANTDDADALKVAISDETAVVTLADGNTFTATTGTGDTASTTSYSHTSANGLVAIGETTDGNALKRVYTGAATASFSGTGSLATVKNGNDTPAEVKGNATEYIAVSGTSATVTTAKLTSVTPATSDDDSYSLSLGDGKADGTEYATVTATKEGDVTTKTVATTAAATGKLTTITLGAETDDVTISAKLANAAQAYGKDNAVSFVLGGKTVQLTDANAAALVYDYTAAAGDNPASYAYTIPANAVLVGLTGTAVTVNSVSYTLNGAKADITGGATNAANTAVLSNTSNSTATVVIGSNTYEMAGGTEAAVSVVTAETDRSSLTLTAGELGLYVAGKTGDATENEDVTEAITVGTGGSVYTLVREKNSTTARDLTVSSKGVVSDLNDGDVFTVGEKTTYTVVDNTTGHYVVERAVAGDTDSETYTFTIYDGKASLASATFSAAATTKVLTVGENTYEGQLFQSYNKVTLTDGKLTFDAAAPAANAGVAFFGTAETPASLTEVTSSTTAADIVAAYKAAQYQLYTSGDNVVLAGGAAEGTATTVDLTALGAVTVVKGEGLNTTLLNFVTQNGSFALADNAGLISIAQADGTDTISGKVAVTLSAGAEKYNLATLGATATIAYTAAEGDTTTLNGVTYSVETAGKTATLTVGADSVDTLAIASGSTVKVDSASYKATADSSLKVDHSAAPVVSAYSGTFELATGTASLQAKTLASGALQTITAASGTTVSLTVADGVVTKIARFGDFASDAANGSESITIGGVTYTVTKATDPDTSAVTYTLSNGDTTKTLDKNDKRLTDLASLGGADLSALTGSDFWLTTGEYVLQTEGKLDLAAEATDLETARLGTKLLELKTTQDGTAIATLERSGGSPYTYTLKKSGTDAVTLAISGEASGATFLTDGFGNNDAVSIVVAASAAEPASTTSVTVNGVQYDNASTANTATVAVDGSGSYLSLGTVKLTIEADDVAANNSVTVKDGSVVTILKGSEDTSNITVTNTGVVSGLAAGDTFTISNSNGIATKYVVGTASGDKITITATGGYNASYEVTAANIGKITITSNLAGADTVADTTPDTVTLQTDNTVTAALEGSKYTLVKALVDATGAITGYTTEVVASKPSDDTVVDLAPGIADGAIIGYFYTSVAEGSTTATVTYTGSRIGAPVTLDAEALSVSGITMTAGDSDPDNLRFINVPAGSSVTVGTTNYAETAGSGAEGAAFGGISYARSYTLSDAVRTITLSAATSATGGIKYYKVTPGDTATKGFVSCTLVAADTVMAGDNYFKVTYEEGTKTYKVEYVPATTESAAIDLTDSSWAGIVVSGTGIDAASIVTVEPTGAKDTYAVTVPVGVDVTADSAVSTTWTGAYTTAGSDSIALGAFAGLTGDTVTRYVAVSATSSKGITTVSYGDELLTTAPSGSYLTFTKTGTTLKVAYTKAEGGPSLTRMTTDGTNAQGVALNFSGLTSDNIKVVDIDDTTGTGGTVDYALRDVPAGTTFKGASFDSDATAAAAGKDSRTFATSYKSEITLTLPSETKYISLKAIADGATGFTTYAVDGDWSSTADTSRNQFKVTVAGGNCTLEYIPSTTESNAFDLSGLNVTVNANGFATGKTLTANTKSGGEAVVGSYTVTNLTVGATATADDTSKLSYTYVESFVLAEGAEVDLTGLDAASGTTIYYQVEIETDGRATIAASNRANKGKTTYKITKATEQPTEGSYITATYQVDGGTGKVNISYTTPDTVADKIDLTSLPVTVDASGLETTTVDEFSVGTTHSNVNYEVTGLPKSVTALTKATSDVVTNAYRITYEFASGEESGLVVTNEGTRYFEVSSTYGTGETNVSQKGVKQISLADADTTKPTDTTKNYFTVTNTGTGVTIKYTAATTGADIIDLSTAPALKIDASGLDANVTSIEILDGGDANYKFTDVRGSATVTKTDEGSTVDVTYAATYQTEGKITLSSEGTGLVFFDVTRSVDDKNVATYTIGEASDAPTSSNYFTVDYRVAGKVSINYTNDGTSNFDLTDKVAVAVDAASLPAGVTAIDVVEKNSSGTAITNVVNYALSNVDKSVTVTKDSGDTVSYLAESVWNDSAKSITLNATANQYYTVTEAYTYATDDDDTTPVTKVTYSIDTVSNTKPTSGKSYFAVTYDSAAGSYKIRYFKGSSARYDFAEGGLALTVNAGSQSYKTIDIDDSEGAQANYALTGVAGGTTVTGIDEGKDTVAYSTTFAWNDGTYYLLPNETTGAVDVTTSGAAAVVPAAGKTYLAATVTQYVPGSEVTGVTEVPETVSFAWVTPNATTGVMETAEAPENAGTITVTVNTYANAAKFKAPATSSTLVIDGVSAGQEILVPEANTNTIVRTGSTFAENASFKLNGTSYTQGGKNNEVITLNSSGQVLSGTLKVTLGETLTAATKKEVTNAANEVVKVLTGGGVTVVLDDGTDAAYGIKSISDLGTNESIQVTRADGKTYTYTSDATGTTITCTVDGKTTKAGLLAKDGDIFSLNYVENPTAYEAGGFSWSAGTYYLGGVANDGTVTVATDATKTAITGSDNSKYYVQAVVTVNEGVYTLALTPKQADTLGQLQDATAYKGTVTVNAPNAAISYDGTGKTYKVNVTNAAADSVFTGLGALDSSNVPANDKVVTQALEKGESVTVNGAVYTQYAETAAALTFQNSEASGTPTAKSGWGLVAGTILVTEDSGTIQTYNTNTSSNPKAQTLIYQKGSEAEDGVVVTVVSTNATDAITSITGLTGGESVTITNNGVTTTYTADAAGTTITKTVTDAEGKVLTSTATLTTAGTEIINGISYGTAVTTGTLDWTKESVGYFKLSTGNNASVKAGELTTVEASGTYIVAKVTSVDATTGVATLTLQKATSDASGVLGDADNIDTAAVTVSVDAGGKVLSFTKETGTNGYSAVFTNVGAQSVFANLKADTDSVTTQALAQNAAISVNSKVLISAAADNVLVVKGSADNTSSNAPRIESGAVQIGGKYQGETVTIGSTTLTKGTEAGVEKTVYGTTSVASLAYTAGAASAAVGGYEVTTAGAESNGVLASFTGGGVTSITDLKGGEKVTVQYSTAAGGKKYVYTALDDAGTAVKCDIYASSAASEIESTTYCEGITSGANILDYTFKNVQTVTEFNWTGTKTDDATSATGYFEISGAGAAAVTTTQTKTTISGGSNAGKHYLAVDVTKADGKTTITSLKEYEVKLDGTLQEVATADAELATVSFAVPSAAGPVVFSKPSGLLVTMTGVTAGSVLSGFSAKDSITTVALDADTNEYISLGSKKYFAGADGALTLSGDGKVEDGTLVLSTNAEAGLSGIDTYYMDRTTGKETTATVSYSSDEKKITGAVVKVANGGVESLTGLTADETVEVTTYTTDGTGTTTATKTTYAVVDNVYTKTEETAGVRTVYTLKNKNSSGEIVGDVDVDDTVDLVKIGASEKWDSSSTTSKTAFDWSNTGYFAATATKVGDTVTGYTASAATQTEPVSINATKAGQYYAKVVSTGNAAKGYTVSSIDLVLVNAKGVANAVTSAATPLTLAVTLPNTGNVTLPAGAAVDYNGDSTNDYGAHTGYTLALTNAQAGGVYKGLGAGDSISSETLAAGETLTIYALDTDGTISATAQEYTSAGAAALSLKNDSGKLEIQSGIVKLGAAQSTGFTGIGYDAADYKSDSVVTSSTVAYNNNTDGVIATYANGKVTSITDLDANETVTVTERQIKTVYTDADGVEITAAEYDADTTGKVKMTITTTTVTKAYAAAPETSTKPATTKITANVATSITKAEGTKTEWASATTPTPKSVLNVTELWKMDKVADVTDINVVNLAAEGYSITSQFDWVTNAKGYFEITEGKAEVAKQTDLVKVTADKTYVRIVLDSTTATKATSLMPVKYDASTGAFLEDTTFSGTIEIPATGKGLTVPANADRSYTIVVTDAVSKEEYTGLGENDTVTMSVNSAVGDIITVNGRTFRAAQAGSFTVSGTGIAMEGIFNVNQTDNSPLNLTETAANGTVTDYAVTAGANTAVQVEVKEGAIVSIKGLGAGETLTVVKTVTPKSGSGTTETTTYTGAPSSTTAGGVTVKKEVTVGVSTTTSTTEIGVGAVETTDVFGADYGTGTVKTEGDFAWAASQKGYFDYEYDSGSKKKTATIEAKHFKVGSYSADELKQYVEVTVDATGTSSLRLVTLDKDGSFVDAGSNFSTDTVITLKTDATNGNKIKFVKPSSANYALKVDGPLAAGSSLTGLKKTDMVNSTTAGEVDITKDGVIIGGTGLTVKTEAAVTDVVVNNVTYAGTGALTIKTGATAASDYLESGTITLGNGGTVKAYDYVVSDAETGAGNRTLMTVSVTDNDLAAADKVSVTAGTKNIGTEATPNNVAALTFAAEGLTGKSNLTVSVTDGGKTESYTVDAGGNITCSDGNTYYVTAESLKGKTIELDGTLDTLVTGGTKVLKTAVADSIGSYSLTLSQTGANTYYADSDGTRLLNVTYAEATGYTVAAVDATAGAKVAAIDTTALASDTIVVNPANMTTADIIYKNVDGGKTVIEAANNVTITGGEVSGVTALTLISGAFTTASTAPVTVTTVSSPATVGGVTYKGTGLTIMTSATNTGLVAGTVEAANATLKLTANGTAFTTAEVIGSASLTVGSNNSGDDNGKVTSIANLSAGESVATTSGTTVITYTAVDDTHIEKTGDTANNGLLVIEKNESFSTSSTFTEVKTTPAGKFGWVDGNKTYRLVASGIDLTADSTKSEFTYSDSTKHVYETAVAHANNSTAYTVTVTEKVVDAYGDLTAAAEEQDAAGSFTIQTGKVTNGNTVNLKVAPTSVDETFTVSGDQDSITLKGDGTAVAGTFAYAAGGLAGSKSGAVTIAGVSVATNTVTFKDGLVTAIGGLDAGESVSFKDEKGRMVTYAVGTADAEGNCTVTRTIAGSEETATEALETLQKKGITLSGGLEFTTEKMNVTQETAGEGQGQFQWSNSQRGVGYFTINKPGKTAATKLTIADQSKKTIFDTSNDGEVYMVAALENDVLTLTARTANVEEAADGTTKVSFTDTTYTGAVTINVAKDYTGDLVYDGSGDRSYSVNFTGVQEGAAISGLKSDEKVTTVSLSENDTVAINGVTYTAGAKGSLTFQDGRLLNGTVKITSELNNTVLTAGNANEAAKTLKNAVFGGEDNSGEYIIKVTNGKITSITGLVDQNDSLTVTEGTTDTVYTVLDTDGTMLQRTVGTANSFATIKSGANVYLAESQWKTGETIPGAADGWSGKTTRYYRVGTDLTDPAQLVESATTGTPGDYYLEVSANNGTISGVKLMEVNAQGGLTASKLNVNTAYAGTLAIEAGNTALTYSAPASRQWRLVLTGLAAESKITNLLDGDTAATAEISTGLVTVNNVKLNVANDTADTLTLDGGKPAAVTSSGTFALMAGALTLTTYGAGVATKVTYGGGKDTILVNVSGGSVTGITGLGGSGAASGKVTMETVAADGKVVTTYELKNGVLTKTEVAVDGTATTSTATDWAVGTDLMAASYGNGTLKDVEYNFTWTTEGTAGYFKLPTSVTANTTTTVRAAKGTIKTTDTASRYIGVKLAAGNGVEIQSIAVVGMTENGMDTVENATYSGKLALAVPNAQVTFDRSNVGASVADAAISLTGAAAGSVISNLKAGETVKTMALTEDAVVTVNQNTLLAGARNTTLQVEAVDNADVALLAGKVKLVADNSIGAAEAVKVGSNPEISVTNGTIIVSASGNGKTYTIEDIGQGETFAIGSDTYMRSEKTIIRTDSQGNVAVYNIGTSAALASSVIEKGKWLAVAEYNSTANKNHVTIDLKAADAQFTKLDKADALKASYGYVTDSVVDTTSANKTNNSLVSTLLVDSAKQDWQVDLGTAVVRDGDGKLLDVRTYTVNDSVGQNIKANTAWSVAGGTGADTITGASSGSDTLAGGDGNDSLVGGGASDYFVHSGGMDTIKGYVSGKDVVKFTTAFGTAKENITVSGTDVTVKVADDDTVTLLAAANASKGVTIQNGDAEAVYYFGNGTKATNFTTYTEDAYYYGAAAGSKLTVGTDKTKATKTTLGNTVEVVLTDGHYNNISEVNAAGSANKVDLTAGEGGSTLRGGSYQTTLRGGAGSDVLYGGSGEDTFWFDPLVNDGADTVMNYDAAKDKLHLSSQLSDSSYSTSGNSDLVLTLGTGKTVTVAKAVNGKAVNVEDADNTVVSYYFGKSGANNTMTGKDSNTDVFIAGYDSTKTLTIKNFEAADTIKLTGISESITGNNLTIKEFMDDLGATMTSTTTRTGVVTSTMKVGNKTVLSVTGVSLSDATVSVTDGVATITKDNN